MHTYHGMGTAKARWPDPAEDGVTRGLPARTVRALEDDMTSRRMLWHTRPAMILSSSLLLGTLVLPAAAETTGERALLNRSIVPVAAPSVQAAPEGKVDGERALLNRPAAHETTIASRPGVIPGGSADQHRVSGERALLGRVDLGASTSLYARHK